MLKALLQKIGVKSKNDRILGDYQTIVDQINALREKFEQLSDEELDAMIDEAISSTGAESIRDMGKVMGQIKGKAAGRADMGAVGAKVKARLG